MSYVSAPSPRMMSPSWRPWTRTTSSSPWCSWAAASPSASSHSSWRPGGLLADHVVGVHEEDLLYYCFSDADRCISFGTNQIKEETASQLCDLELCCSPTSSSKKTFLLHYNLVCTNAHIPSWKYLILYQNSYWRCWHVSPLTDISVHFIIWYYVHKYWKYIIYDAGYIKTIYIRALDILAQSYLSSFITMLLTTD